MARHADGLTRLTSRATSARMAQREGASSATDELSLAPLTISELSLTERLPFDLLESILSHADPPAICAAGGVCRALRRTAPRRQAVSRWGRRGQRGRAKGPGRTRGGSSGRARTCAGDRGGGMRGGATWTAPNAMRRGTTKPHAARSPQISCSSSLLASSQRLKRSRGLGHRTRRRRSIVR